MQNPHTATSGVGVGALVALGALVAGSIAARTQDVTTAFLAAAVVVLGWAVVRLMGATSAPHVVVVIAFTVLGDRLVLLTGVGGGSGILRLAWFALVALAAALLIARAETWRTLSLLAHRTTPWLYFIALGALLPIAGIVVGQPVRTVAGAITPLAAGASALLGALAAANRSDDGQSLDRLERALTGVAWVSLAAAVAQFLYYTHRRLVPWLTEIIMWDRASTVSAGARAISSRSTGIFTNPNTLGLLGGALMLYALFGCRSLGRKMLLLLPAGAIIVLAQSRGVAVALGAALLVELIAGLRKTRIDSRAFAALAALGIVAITVMAIAIQFSPSWVANLSRRFSSLAGVVLGGASADANLAARVGFWSRALPVLTTHPLGTLGPPESFLGTATDSDIVRITLQGGALYLASFIGAIGWMVTAGGASPWRPVLRPLGIFIAVAALTQLPTATPVFAGLVALLVGLHAAWEREPA